MRLPAGGVLQRELAAAPPEAQRHSGSKRFVTFEVCVAVLEDLYTVEKAENPGRRAGK